MFGNPLGAHFPPWNWRICGSSDPALFGLWAYHKSLALGDALLCKRSPRRAWSKENVFALSVPAWVNHRVTINKEKETAARKLITWNRPFPPFPFSRMVQCIICMFLTGQFWYILMPSLLTTVVVSLFSQPYCLTVAALCCWETFLSYLLTKTCVIVLAVPCSTWAEGSISWEKRC